MMRIITEEEFKQMKKGHSPSLIAKVDMLNSEYPSVYVLLDANEQLRLNTMVSSFVRKEFNYNGINDKDIRIAWV